MIAPKDSIDSQSTETPLPNEASGASDMEGKAATGSGERDGSRSSFNSKKTYVAGKLHTDLRVPFREISLAPTKSMNGEIEVNDPVRVYDTSGRWGDADFHGDVTQGLPALRAKWIRDRGDVEEYEGRVVRPIDDGYLSEKHAAIAEQQRSTASTLQRPTFNGAGAPSRRRAHCAPSVGHRRHAASVRSPGNHHPGDGIHCNPRERPTNRESRIENRTKRFTSCKSRITRLIRLRQQHAGESFDANIPREITPEFVRQGSRARSRHHSCKHQSPGIRADDHRPQFPGKNQR